VSDSGGFRGWTPRRPIGDPLAAVWLQRPSTRVRRHMRRTVSEPTPAASTRVVTKGLVPLAMAIVVSACAATSTLSPTQPAAPGGTSSDPTLAASDAPRLTTTAAASPSTPAQAARLQWEEVTFDGTISDVMGDGSRFVAVGAGDASEGTTAWTSIDGIDWEPHPVPERSFGEIGDGQGLRAGMGTLLRLGDTVYSFGSMSFNDSVQGAGWRWTDGNQWEVIESKSAVFGGRITDAAASADALLAVQISFAGGLYGSFSTWLWTPATSWVMTPLSSSEDEDIGVAAVSWAPGTYVAAGWSALAAEGAERWNWPRTPALWTSTDGMDWTAVPVPEGMSSVCDIVEGPSGGFVAMGTAGDRLAAWTSDDGRSWQQAKFDLPDTNAYGLISAAQDCSMAVAADLLVGVVSDQYETRVWTSHDGDVWSFDEQLNLSNALVAGSGDRLVIVGSREGEQTSAVLSATLR
jgi:hypothetical protein